MKISSRDSEPGEWVQARLDSAFQERWERLQEPLLEYLKQLPKESLETGLVVVTMG